MASRLGVPYPPIAVNIPQTAPKSCVRRYEWLDSSTLELKLPKNKLRLSFLNASLVRCHYQSGPVFEQIPSYGVANDFAASPTPLQEEENPIYYQIATPNLILRIRKKDAGLEFYDAHTGRLLSSDAEGMGFRRDKETGNEFVWVLKKIPQKAHFFGLGDKPCDLNMRGKRFEMWGADHFKYTPESDPLYKSVPFYICANEGQVHGIFFDNTMRSYFDFGHEREDRVLFGADGGFMDYYFIAGKTGLEVVQNYTRLTGLPPMPPLWSLGYQQSRWSYYPQSEVENLAAKLRTRRIPCDVIYMDIHHMKDYQSFTWNREYFSKPAQMIHNLEFNGFKCVCIINPGIKINAENYVWRSGYERNVFCRRHDGMLLMGDVWPGRCNFPDFTSPDTREWWANLFERQIVKYGVRGIWTDMNEPVIFPDKTFPSDTRHHFDGFTCSHLKAHNVYGQCMAKATRLGMETFAPTRRPFVLSRSGFAGLQRYAATWTGDNYADWSNLKMANHMIQRLATSGISFCGSDTGGFLGHPTPELFCRWMQLSAFQPLFRNHSNGEFGGQEPWCFGEEIEEYCRKAIEERYRLLPYFYTQFYRYSSEGTPIIRSLFLSNTHNEDSYWRSSEFYVGDSLYVVPVHHPDESGRTLYIPEGNWYSLWDDKPVENAGTERWVETSLANIPVFVRGGHIIPRWPVQQYVGEQSKPKLHYELWWAPDASEQSFYYEDAGDGHGYRIAQYLLHQFDYKSAGNSFCIQQSSTGAYEPCAERVECLLHGLPAGANVSLWVDEQEIAIGEFDAKGVLHFILPMRFKELRMSF